MKKKFQVTRGDLRITFLTGLVLGILITVLVLNLF